jgi:hypothetical protein
MWTISIRCLILLVGGLFPVVFLSWPCAAAARKGGVTVETVPYQGWKNNLRLHNDDAELLITLEVGPRILSYRLSAGKNVFKEYPDQLGKTGERDWMIRGGHRLSVAPEDPQRSFAPDNAPVSWKVLDKESGLVRLTPEPDAGLGIQKEMDVQLAGTGSRVQVIHRIRNISGKPLELSPWAITVLAPGGVEIIPQPAKRPYPKDPRKARSAADYAPQQSLVLWPYFSFHNQGWNFGPKYITLWPSTTRQGAKYGPTKAGLAHRLSWVGYLNAGTLFVKRFEYEEGKIYPDNGCNLETFADPDMLGIESLGPLVKLGPGATIEHTETWDLVSGVGSYVHQFEIDKVVLSKVPPR